VRIPWHRRLSVQQLLITFVSALVLGLLSGLVQLVYDLRADIAARDAAVEQIIDILTEPAAQAAYALDTGLADRVVAGLSLYQHVSSAEIRDNYGRVMARQARSASITVAPGILGLLLPEPATRIRPLFGGRGQELVGELRVDFDLPHLLQTLEDRAWVIFGSGLIRNFLLALLLAAFFYLALTRPLVDLVGQIERVNLEDPGARELTIPALHSQNEFGLLVRRTNEILRRSGEHLVQRDRDRLLLRALLDNLPARVTLKDRDLRFVIANRAFSEAFGKSESEVIGRTVREVFAGVGAPPENMALARVVERMDQAVLETGEPQLLYETSLRDVTGEEQASLDSKVPLRDAAGSVYAVLTISINITARKQAEVALDAANHQLRQQAANMEVLAEKLMRERESAIAASRAKSEFLANMSHELRTPLNAIIGFAEVITLQLWGPQSGRYFEYAKDIGVSARHLLNVINDILDMAKIEAGRHELMPEPTDMKEVIAAGLTIVKGRARENQVTLIDETAGLKLPVLLVDPRSVKQVLINLLSNAIKFTPPGGTVRVGYQQESDAWEVFSVTDSGIGIAPDNIDRVFEPFWQGEDSIRRGIEGTGLGLTISRNFMQQHGGALRINSAEGEGTRAAMFFPASLRSE